MAGVKPIDKPAPVPPADSWLPANRLTESQLESLPSFLPKQHKLVDLEPTTLTTLGMASDESLAVQDKPAPLRQSAHTMRSQLPWRYLNFTPQQDNTTPGAFDVWDGLHT